MSSTVYLTYVIMFIQKVSGSRLWFFLPPGTSKKVVGKKVNGCDYLLGHSPLPKGVSVCLQEQANVMYLPPQWLHATWLVLAIKLSFNRWNFHAKCQVCYVAYYLSVHWSRGL